MEIRVYRPEDRDAVVELWNLCGLVAPWNDPVKDIERKLGKDPELFLVGVEEGRIAATAMGGYEGHRGWVNYVAVHPDFQRRGFGRNIMFMIQELLLDRACPKINLQVRRTNAKAMRFYESIGFAVDDVVSMGKRLIHDEGE